MFFHEGFSPTPPMMQVYSKGSSRGKPSTQKHTFVASFLLLLLVGGSKVQFAFPDIHAFA